MVGKASGWGFAIHGLSICIDIVALLDTVQYLKLYLHSHFI